MSAPTLSIEVGEAEPRPSLQRLPVETDVRNRCWFKILMRINLANGVIYALKCYFLAREESVAIRQSDIGFVLQELYSTYRLSTSIWSLTAVPPIQSRDLSRGKPNQYRDRT